jgi:hypothetical protein
VAARDLLEHVVRLGPRRVVEKRLASVAADGRPKGLVDCARTPIQRARRQHDPRHTLAEVGDVEVLLGRDVVLRLHQMHEATVRPSRG